MINKNIISLLARFVCIISLTTPTMAYATQWKGYVCKVMDYFECKQGKKRIYPRAERYDDEETCYEEFGKIFETDREMARLYPQTNDAHESYIYGCIKD